MRFKSYYNSLSKHERARFCARSGLSDHYIRYALFATDPRFKRRPSADMIDKLYTAGQGKISYIEILSEFFPQLGTEIVSLVGKAGGNSDGRPRPIDTAAATETTGDQSNRTTDVNDRCEA